MSAKMLWKPDQQMVTSSNMWAFMRFVEKRRGLKFEEYEDIYRWSTTELAAFWEDLWEFVGIISSSPYTSVLDDPEKMPGAVWFDGATLNFAQNLLRFRDDRDAIVFKGEGRAPVRLTYAQLYDRVASLARSLRKAGVEKGDRVVGFVPNMPQSIIAMLAATSIGAIWSSSSPDFGFRGVLDRFGQVKPKILFTADGYNFKGKRVDSLDKVREFLPELPTVEKVVVIPYTQEKPDLSGLGDATLFDDFAPPVEGLEIEFEQVPFDHPVYIMYSSGTTGLPKCLVQSVGGILVHHLKELALHTNLTREDKIFYFTTCGWMMWNWLVSSLGVGATVVIYDGNPFHPGPETLWKMAEEEKLTVFGTSAGYLAALEKAGYKPGEDCDLSSLKAVLSTGSPLSIESFEYVYKDIKSNLQLSSIAGGTDLNGCFALGNPMLPVYAGELQCRGLGMKVDALDDDGNPIIGEQGELVCSAPFPSMPIYFWDDEDGTKYHDAYFRMYPGVWRHGDFIVVSEHGGVIMYGRSDSTLNAGGVRIGTAEIYRLVQQLDFVEDSLVIGQPYENDVRVILFAKLLGGEDLTGDRVAEIRAHIRKEASPRHVPSKIIQVPDIPYTLSGKKVELAVRKIVAGKEVLNRDALRNPECLEFYSNLEELKT